jgi:prevent-host-death family protein
MKSISVPIGKARTNLCDLVEQAKSGTRVTITTHGRPAAVLAPVSALATPWRVKKPDDPARYGDLQKPVLEPWP